uniref:Tripartite motif containing 36 n=1 Tax=Suricata suricatta TaxID=37032 RepID=A0A673T3F0_SURSU
MSDPGEISEFGYIMELLARGKASAKHLQQTREHPPLTSKVREGCPSEIAEVRMEALAVRI